MKKLKVLMLENGGLRRGKANRVWWCIPAALVIIAVSPYCAGQSGGGSSSSTAPAQRPGRAGALTYPSVVSNAAISAADSATQSNTIPLRKPESLNAAGIYVWKDSDGSWNLGLVATNDRIAFSGELTSPGTIGVDPVQNDGGLLQSVNPNRVRFAFDVVGKITSFARFRTDADLIDFDLRVNGSEDASFIFLGSSKLNPGRTSFRITEQVSGARLAQTELTTQQVGSSAQVSSGAGNGGGPVKGGPIQ